MTPPKDSRLLGADGLPLGPEPQQGLAPEIQSYIEKQVRIATGKPKWYATGMATIYAFIIFLYFNTNHKKFVQEIPAIVTEHVIKQTIEPEVKKTIEGIISEKATNYINPRMEAFASQLNPLEQRVGNLDKTTASIADLVRATQLKLEEIEKSILQRQETLALAQTQLEQLGQIEQLAVSAKAGNEADFKKLTELAKGEDKINAVASNAISEVEAFYDVEHRMLTFEVKVDNVSMKDPGWTIEELIVMLDDPDWRGRAATVNTIAAHKDRKLAVVVLCDSFISEPNLRVKSRINYAISQISDTEFRPLDLVGVPNWWRLQGGKNEYPTVMREWRDWRRTLVANESIAIELDSPPTLTKAQKIESEINFLNSFLEKHPESLFASCQQALRLAYIGKMEEAELALNQVKSRDARFRWYLYIAGIIDMMQGREEEAVSAITKLLEVSPGMEKQVLNNPTLLPLILTGKVLLPSAKQVP